MGDVAMLPHALKELRRNYPDLRITVVTRSLFAPFFDGLGVDFLFMDTKGKHHGLLGIIRFSKEILSLGVDAVADMHGVFRSRLLTFLLSLHGVHTDHIHKGKLEKWFRLGYSHDNAVPLRHTVIRYCRVLQRLGFEMDIPKPVEGQQKRDNPFGTKSGTWIGFAPFSAHEGKTYPAEHREPLVELLAKKYDHVFIHSGGGEEKDFAVSMEKKYENVTAIYGKVDMRGEMDLIANLDCLIAMDSLAMHLGALMGTKVVSIWGATHPQLGFLGYGCDPEGVIQNDFECRPCSIYGKRPCKYKDYRCIHSITPQMVMEKLDYILKKNSGVKFMLFD
ncbi:MAG: glycosyltransferase family 9 protein [Alistipes sp.]|nr:glycosyltransferase family 9 protein [Candidatus Alistipes equi]